MGLIDVPGREGGDHRTPLFPSIHREKKGQESKRQLSISQKEVTLETRSLTPCHGLHRLVSVDQPMTLQIQHPTFLSPLSLTATQCLHLPLLNSLTEPDSSWAQGHLGSLLCLICYHGSMPQAGWLQPQLLKPCVKTPCGNGMYHKIFGNSERFLNTQQWKVNSKIKHIMNPRCF